MSRDGGIQRVDDEDDDDDRDDNNLLTFLGHNKCGVNIVASVSGDILFEASWSAAILSSPSNRCRKLRCSGESSRNSSWSAVTSLDSDDSMIGGYCALERWVGEKRHGDMGGN